MGLFITTLHLHIKHTQLVRKTMLFPLDQIVGQLELFLYGSITVFPILLNLQPST